MAFVEDTSLFFDDFAVDVIWGEHTTKGILDKPDVSSMDFAAMPDFALTFETEKLPGLVRDESLTVNGEQYITQAPQKVSDGKISVVGLIRE
jgi:hypothetical protein